MISYLKGKIKFRGDRFIVLQTGDIGFQVFLTETFLQELIKQTEVELFTYLHSRENALELYGFKTREDLDFFEKLIDVPGIGPKSALGVLSLTTPQELKRAINQGNAEVLTKVSGIGKKTAERIIVELKSKFENAASQASFTEVDGQVFDALTKLGYSVQEIRKAIKEIPLEIQGLEARVKEALKILGGK